MGSSPQQTYYFFPGLFHTFHILPSNMVIADPSTTEKYWQ